MCFDGVERLCHIRGKLRKKVWIAESDKINETVTFGEANLDDGIDFEDCSSSEDDD